MGFPGSSLSLPTFLYFRDPTYAQQQKMLAKQAIKTLKANLQEALLLYSKVEYEKEYHTSMWQLDEKKVFDILTVDYKMLSSLRISTNDNTTRWRKVPEKLHTSLANISPKFQLVKLSS